MEYKMAILHPGTLRLVDSIFNATPGRIIITDKSKLLLSAALSEFEASEILDAYILWHIERSGTPNPNEFALDVGQVVRWWRQSLTRRLFEANKKVLGYTAEFGSSAIFRFCVESNKRHFKPEDDSIWAAHNASKSIYSRGLPAYFETLSALEKAAKDGTLCNKQVRSE